MLFPASLDNRQIASGIAVTHRLHKVKAMIEARGIQIIEKQAADAALLVTVFEKEIIIAPLFFITRINVFAEGLAQIAGRYDASARHLLQSRSRGLNRSHRRTTIPDRRPVFPR